MGLIFSASPRTPRNVVVVLLLAVVGSANYGDVSSPHMSLPRGERRLGDKDVIEVRGMPPPDIWEYHKTLSPLDESDCVAIVCATLALTLAASGGIGGGGILVPMFIIVLGFRPKHAIALANVTILGGAIANTALNCKKRHPQLNQPLIDWDLIVVMEPLTIFGAVFGSLLSKVLPNIVITLLLVVVLWYMGRRTFNKGVRMWTEESRKLLGQEEFNPLPLGLDLNGSGVEMFPTGALPESEYCDVDRSYSELESDCEGKPLGSGRRVDTSSRLQSQRHLSFKIWCLTLCFVGTVVLTLLKGGGQFASPFHVTCGSTGYWILYFSCLPWVLGFALYFRRMLVMDFREKVVRGYAFIAGEVQWTPRNTMVYPMVCALAGLFAGLFGVGGGIVKGPLMLEMGVIPSVASASSAAMILFTSASASVSFMVFGLLHETYGMFYFLLGLTCTAASQTIVTRSLNRYNRQSPIVLSIGAVILLSSGLVALNIVMAVLGEDRLDLVKLHGVCTTEA